MKQDASPPAGALATGRAPADAPRPSIPDAAAMRRWLLSDAVLAADGSILSWANPANPGYAYAEAAGLYLSIMCTSSGFGAAGRAAADRVAARLCAALHESGGVGRDGITYLFDSAVALSGLLRHRATGTRVATEPTLRRLRRFVAEQIERGIAVVPGAAASDGRWSTQFGAHLLKSLHSLRLYAKAFDDALPVALVETLINGSGHQPSPVYVHPFCYEQEGHVIVEYYGLANLFEPVDGALDWLAALQQPDGGLLAFANGMEGFGEPRSDATAQAVRLWMLRDRQRYGAAIARAFAFLAACQTPEGGIRYTPERDDVCSWSTMFALQAVEWFVDRPHLDELL